MTTATMSPLRRRMVEDMQIRGLEATTQASYIRAIEAFAGFLGRSPDSATPAELRAWQLHMARAQVSIPVYNHRITVLRFFFSVTCGRDEMTRPLRFRWAPRKLPEVLSPDEVARLLDAAPGPGLKYRAAFSVAYGAGLRASEVVNLKLGDIDSARMIIRVEQGKGRKDRHVMLSPHLLELLRNYYREARPQGWLFPGQNPLNPVTTRQLNRACRTARAAAGLAKRVTPHTVNRRSNVTPDRRSILTPFARADGESAMRVALSRGL